MTVKDRNEINKINQEIYNTAIRLRILSCKKMELERKIIPSGSKLVRVKWFTSRPLSRRLLNYSIADVEFFDEKIYSEQAIKEFAKKAFRKTQNHLG